MALENDFLSKSLQASKGSTLEEHRVWRGALYGEVMQLEGKAGLSIVEACDAARLSRAGFYRHFDEHAATGRHGTAPTDPADLSG